MNNRIIALILLMMISLTACKNVSDSSSEIKNETSINEKGYTVTAYNQGKKQISDDEKQKQLVDTAEDIVRSECIDELALSLILSSAEIDGYKNNGIYVEITYGENIELNIDSDGDTKSISKIIILSDSGNKKNYAMYYTESGCRIFTISEDAAGRITEIF